MNVIVKKLSEMRAQTLGEWLEELIQWQENQDRELGLDRWADDGGILRRGIATSIPYALQE